MSSLSFWKKFTKKIEFNIDIGCIYFRKQVPNKIKQNTQPLSFNLFK
jgi:hypothetical protein